MMMDAHPKPVLVLTNAFVEESGRETETPYNNKQIDICYMRQPYFRRCTGKLIDSISPFRREGAYVVMGSSDGMKATGRFE